MHEQVERSFKYKWHSYVYWTVHATINGIVAYLC